MKAVMAFKVSLHEVLNKGKEKSSKTPLTCDCLPYNAILTTALSTSCCIVNTLGLSLVCEDTLSMFSFAINCIHCFIGSGHSMTTLETDYVFPFKSLDNVSHWIKWGSTLTVLLQLFISLPGWPLDTQTEISFMYLIPNCKFQSFSHTKVTWNSLKLPILIIQLHLNSCK